MRETETKTFQTCEGPLPVQVVQLPAMRAAKLLIRLLETLGPGVASLATVVNPAGTTINLDALPGGVSALFEKLDGDRFENLLGDLLTDATVTMRGSLVPLSSAQLNTLFRGHVLELFKLAVFSIQVNYSDFFDGLGGFGRLAEKMKATATGVASPSPVSSISSGQPNV